MPQKRHLGVAGSRIELPTSGLCRFFEKIKALIFKWPLLLCVRAFTCHSSWYSFFKSAFKSSALFFSFFNNINLDRLEPFICSA